MPLELLMIEVYKCQNCLSPQIIDAIFKLKGTLMQISESQYMFVFI